MTCASEKENVCFYVIENIHSMKKENTSSKNELKNSSPNLELFVYSQFLKDSEFGWAF